MSERKAGPGASPKINPARLSKYLKFISEGNYPTVSAEASGITYQTVRNWRAKGHEYLNAMRANNPEIDAELADWLIIWPDNFNDTNPMWDAPPPSSIPVNEWIYVLFILTEKNAAALAEVKLMKKLQSAGKKQWQSFAWVLERTHRDRYGRTAIIEAEAQGNQLTAVSDEELMAKLKALKAQKELGRA